MTLKSVFNRFDTPLEDAAEHCRQTKNKESSELHLLTLPLSPALSGALLRAPKRASKGYPEYTVYNVKTRGEIQQVAAKATFGAAILPSLLEKVAAPFCYLIDDNNLL